MGEYETYVNEWMSTRSLLEEEYDIEGEYCFSLDLDEATYRIPHVVLDEHAELMDSVMGDFKPWQVFGELFKEQRREVVLDELANKGYIAESDPITSSSGSFMGDGLSFIHLTLLLAGLTRAAAAQCRIKRPMGQTIGDDLFQLKAKLKYCLWFLYLAEQLGCRFSKINSICKDAATFCEQYLCKISDIDVYEDLEAFKDSVFGDLMFLDTIKGSALSGKPKVKAEKSAPFLGHATLVTKQITWNPISSVKERTKIFLWARNYRIAQGLGTKFAALPVELGGLGIEIGNHYDFNSEEFQTLQKYFEGMMDLPQAEFLQFYLLLRGIFKANPKGFSYENDWEKIKSLTPNVVIISERDVMSQLPEYILKKSKREQLSYINNHMKLLSFHDLADLLARYEAFQKHWECKSSNTFMALPMKESRQRVNKAIAILKSEVQPREICVCRSIPELANSFRFKTYGLYVHKEDPAIVHEFSGMPTLEIHFNR